VVARGTDNLRDDVTRALHDDEVALANVLSADVVLVVEGRARDRDTADVDGLELGQRIEHARAPDPDVDLEESGDRGRRCPLVRARESGALVQ
jgi:hypothetical protein